ncbi:MAG TPA: class I SAM-dependent methyltransferase [Burkholderiaceae bacterium]|nr:class I SAM-dependent methyltransferase [Burkholderiaceae bacterium]
MNEIAPSPWVRRFATLISAGGRVLDVACGSGRHARLLASMGYHVEAVDCDAATLVALQRSGGIDTRVADLECGPWPYGAMCFDGVVVTNYLYRPRFAELIEALRPGGVLIYETFMIGNETLGKPTNPDFLLQPDELLDRVRARLTVIAFEQGRVDVPKRAFVQRLCAVAAGVGQLPIDVKESFPHRS